MVTMDLIKLKIPSRYVSIIDQDKFTLETIMGVITKSKLLQGRRSDNKYEYHCNLYIEEDHHEYYTLIEFSSKILSDNYPRLISRESIEDCLMILKGYKLIDFEIKEIIKYSSVLKAAFTKDINFILNKPEVDSLKLLCPTDNYKVTPYAKGITFEQMINTEKSKNRLKIYNKINELNLQKNSKFLNSLKNKAALLDYFNSKTRLEVDAKSAAKVKYLTGSTDNMLTTILNSEVCPIHKSFEKIYDDTMIRSMQNKFSKGLPAKKVDYINGLILNDCGHDLDKVKIVLGNYYNETYLRKVISKFKKEIAVYNNKEDLNRNQEVYINFREAMAA